MQNPQTAANRRKPLRIRGEISRILRESLQIHRRTFAYPSIIRRISVASPLRMSVSFAYPRVIRREPSQTFVQCVNLRFHVTRSGGKTSVVLRAHMRHGTRIIGEPRCKCRMAIGDY
eukprot:965024-Prymnesium_polylepis.1